MYNDPYGYNRRRYRPYRYRNPLRGLATGIFIICLALGFAFSGGFGGHLFLPILFVGLAFSALFSSASTFNPRGIYSGLVGFVWMLGLALCFLIGFWPWILIPVGVSMILGALYNPLVGGLLGAGILGAMQQNQQPPQQAYQQPYQQQNQPQQPYQSYQQGYQPAPQPSGTYEEGGQQHAYPAEPKQSYDQPQPQPQYPNEQELPPMQQ